MTRGKITRRKAGKAVDLRQSPRERRGEAKKNLTKDSSGEKKGVTLYYCEERELMGGRGRPMFLKVHQEKHSRTLEEDRYKGGGERRQLQLINTQRGLRERGGEKKRL